MYAVLRAMRRQTVKFAVLFLAFAGTVLPATAVRSRVGVLDCGAIQIAANQIQTFCAVLGTSVYVHNAVHTIPTSGGQLITSYTFRHPDTGAYDVIVWGFSLVNGAITYGICYDGATLQQGTMVYP